MKKSILIIAGVLCAGLSFSQAQKLYYTRSGHVDFFSSTPMENIKADNDKVTSIIDINTGDIEFTMLNMAFQFEKALMQEHFNENYMESSKFPKSTFKGKIINLAGINFSQDGTYPAEVTGKITIHGVTKDHSAKGNIIVSNGKFRIQSLFTLKPEDFNIAIPNLVRDKIAKEIKVTVDNSYEPYSK